MKRKNKKVIFLSSLLGCSTLIASGLIVSSCSEKVDTQNLNKTNPIIANPTTSLSENQNISDGINLNPSITTNDLTENKDTNNESSITSTQDSSDKLSSTQDDNKISFSSSSDKNENILTEIEKCEDPLKFKIGWYTSSGNTFTINLKSINGNSFFQNGNNLNWIPNLRLFAVNLPYTLEFLGKNSQNVTLPNSNPYSPGIITTSQGKYRANYDYKNIKLNYVYNSSNTNFGYFDGANYGHHLYSNYGFRFNRNYNNNNSEVTFNINLPPVFNPAASTKENNIFVSKPGPCTKGPTFYTSGYIFILKWWKGNLGFDKKEELEQKMKKSLSNYFSKLFKDKNSVNRQNSPTLLTSFFIKHNNGDATNDPINHWHYDGHGYYGQWIADSIYREELKRQK